MGVRYRRRPPRKYGCQAAEPNVGSAYLAEYRTRRGGRYFFTSQDPSLRRTERTAIQDALRAVARHCDRFKKDAPRLAKMLDREQRIWKAMKTQCELAARVRAIAFGLSLVRRMRESGDLIALVLIGSLRSRDFVPGLSDVDLWVLGRRLKPSLKVEFVKKYGQEVEVNLVCRNLRSLRRALREGTPVDLVAVRYGQALYDEGLFRTLQRRAGRYGVTQNTRKMWMKSSARWLSTAVQQYFRPDCAHCFFGALYHAGRDLLRAHLVAQGGGLVEGGEVEAAAGERWPGLAEAFGRIRWARAHWEGYAFPLLEDRMRIEGELGELVLALETIARRVYRDYGLRLPGFQAFFDGFVRRQGMKRLSAFSIRPEEGILWLSYEAGMGKLKFARRKIPRVLTGAGDRQQRST